MGIIQYFDTSRGLIKDNIRDDSRMKAIALFYKLKFKYSNSRVYRYCPQKISKDLGVSVYLSDKLVKVALPPIITHELPSQVISSPSLNDSPVLVFPTELSTTSALIV